MNIYTDRERAILACSIANQQRFEDYVIVDGPEDGQWTLMEEYDAIEAGHEGTRYR